MRLIYHNTLTLAALSAVTLLSISCSGDTDNTIVTRSEPVEAVFNIRIAATSTRASGTSWNHNDQIGIFMLSHGGNLTKVEEVKATNYAYILDLTNHEENTIGDACDYLKAVDKDAGGSGSIYMQPGESYDFISYYPFTPTANLIDGYGYPINLADQYDQQTSADHDLLYATSSRKDIRSNLVSFEFNHMLTNITIKVTRGKGVDVTAYAAKHAVVTGMPTTSRFDLSDGKTFTTYDDITAITSKKADDNGDLYEVIILPQSAGIYKGRAIAFTVSGKSHYWSIPDGFAFESGKRYTYNFILTTSGLEITNDVAISDWTDGGILNQDNTWGKGVKELIKNAVDIPAGAFTMGSEVSDNEQPIHEVSLSAFKMSKYEVTVQEYCSFLNANPDKFTSTTTNVKATLTGTDSFNQPYSYKNVELAVADALTIQYDGSKWYPAADRDHYPMALVSWYGAFAFAEWSGGRLPTEAEWEYANRAGSTTTTLQDCFGIGVTSLENNDPIQITSTNLGNYAWYGNNNATEGYPSGTKPVGLKLPNVWGLHDMHGNVWEWCYDWYDADFYNKPSATENNPVDTTASTFRVYRGGHYFGHHNNCRSAYRDPFMPSGSSQSVGFRIAFSN